MTATDPASVPAGDIELEALMRRVRQIDPGADATAVRRYFSEIREAEAALAAVDADEQALPVAFSPRPPEVRFQ
jgi:hypothetical protein